MKLIATARGFYRNGLIEPGEPFDADDGFKATWAEKKPKPRKEESEETKVRNLKEAVQGKRGE